MSEPDYNDIVARLRECAEWHKGTNADCPEWLEAADEIERLRAERDALRAQLAKAREALEPFAALWDVEETYLIGGMYKLTVKYEKIRRARAVLEKIKGGDGE